MPGRLGIVVVNYASTTLLATNLVRVAAQVPDALVVVVDNLSTADERAVVTSLCVAHGWELVAPADNLGFGAGVNAGVARALDVGCTDLLILNPDAVVDGDAVHALRAAVAEDRLTLVSPIVRAADGRVWFGGSDLYLADGETRARRRRPEHPGAERVEWLSGACLMATAELWRATGGFQDDYFLYWEDVDLSRRVVAAGGTLRVLEDVEALHDEGATHRAAGQVSEAKSPTYYYFNIRNRLLFAVHHLDAKGIARWTRGTPRHAVRVLLRGGKRQFLHPVAPLRAAWRGMRDGRRIVRDARRG
ncbi:glycosyltransferase family 2 protein [Microbacterium gorillae]|uniref:glycosyltransferase family 2 protein n=1 Tax=Microbacterium gorillae TaxID=1231063 RepID=UPI000590ECAA|nr:glycosyltransferase family 2 protein [Microbacterium gorillae]